MHVHFVCMYVCMYICMYACMYVHMYVCPVRCSAVRVVTPLSTFTHASAHACFDCERHTLVWYGLLLHKYIHTAIVRLDSSWRKAFLRFSVYLVLPYTKSQVRLFCSGYFYVLNQPSQCSEVLFLCACAPVWLWGIKLNMNLPT